MGVAALLSAGSGLIGAFGSFEASQYKAHQAEQDAKIGQIKADQIGTAYDNRLRSTIANIRAIRATTNVGADSPTQLAIEAGNKQRSDAARNQAVSNQEMQVDQDQADAKFMNASSYISLAGGIGKSLAKLYEDG